MPEGNIETVRRLYQAFNERDTETTRELMDPKVEWVNPDDAVEPGTRRGFGGYQKALGSFRESCEQARIEIKQIEESDDLVAVVVGLEARGRGSGLQTEIRQSHLWTFRNGKATRFQWFSDPDA